MALNVNIKSLESFSVIIKIIVQRMKCLFVQIEVSYIAHHNNTLVTISRVRDEGLTFYSSPLQVDSWPVASLAMVGTPFWHFSSHFDLTSPDFVHFVSSLDHLGCQGGFETTSVDIWKWHSWLRQKFGTKLIYVDTLILTSDYWFWYWSYGSCREM